MPSGNETAAPNASLTPFAVFTGFFITLSTDLIPVPSSTFSPKALPPLIIASVTLFLVTS